MKVFIGFSSSDWWVSRVIRFFTAAPVSHTYIVLQATGASIGLSFDHELYEAAWCGFRMSTRGKLTSGTTRIVREIEVALDPAASLTLLRSWLETPYNYLGLLGEAWVQIGRYFGKRWRNPFPGPHTFFCSEAACYLAQLAPGDPDLKLLVADLDPRSTSPEDLLSKLEKCRNTPS